MAESGRPAAVELPRVQEGSNPQHLLLTLLGDYWFDQQAPLPSAALVGLLAEFGVSGVSARAALSRLARRGLLELSRQGRRTAYQLTARAGEMLSEGGRHILSFGAGEVEWSGRWTVACFSIPEGQRELRHVLRTKLRWLGFASLYDGVWVCPHDRPAGAAEVLKDLGVLTATVFTAEVGPGTPVGGEPIQAWDLESLRGQYDRMIADFGPVLERYQQGRITPVDALVCRTSLMDAWRNFPNLDPELPRELLPENWPRGRAREVFIALYDGLAMLAEARVRQIVAEYAPDLAPLVRSHGTTFSG